MEISTTFAQLNASFTRPDENAENAERELNAFGIGAANRPEVELSPQARILNEIDRVNSARQEVLDEQLSEQSDTTTEEDEDSATIATTEVFIPVSAEEPQSRTPNLAQRALDLYLSVQDQS